MSGQPQMGHTICLNTRDAVTKSKGKFSIQISNNGPRTSALKISLGSLEFPMVQYTVEEDWNMLYFSEGIRISKEVSDFEVIESLYDKQTYSFVDNLVTVQLPLHLNAITNYSIYRDQICIECAHPHNLWSQANRSLVPLYTWSEIELVCSPLGRISISELFRNKSLSYKSPREFLIPITYWEECVGVSQAASGFLHTPTIPSPSAMALLLSNAYDRTNTTVQFKFTYDATTNKFALTIPFYPNDHSKLKITIKPTKLSRMLGYSSEVTKIFVQPDLQDRDFMTENYATVSQAPLAFESDPFENWFGVNLALGWYQPSHRPMCTGPPLSLTQELELSLNRLYFPIPDRIPDGSCTVYFLMFTDPSGFTHNCPVHPGKYSENGLAKHLETEMSKIAAASLPGCVFSVYFDKETHKFVFSCEYRNDAGQVSPAPFSLIFNHPAQFNPAKIGFSPIALHGSDTYTSTDAVHLPSLQDRCTSNVYKVSELGHQKRLRIQSCPLPNMQGLVVNYYNDDSILHVRTYVRNLPFAHGLQHGDLLSIGKASPASLLVWDENNSEWQSSDFASAPIAARYGKSAIVVSPEKLKTSKVGAFDLFLKVKNTPTLSDHLDTVLRLNTDLQPFNLCFSSTLSKSLKSNMLGYKEGVTQWGIDGCVETIDGVKMPPFLAPNVFSMDHPDYVLMYILEGKHSLTTHHFESNSSTTPFAKIVLYPMFREERMLPKEASFMGGEKMNLITVYFTNPDGTPYSFHGVDFSFSLNFVV